MAAPARIIGRAKTRPEVVTLTVLFLLLALNAAIVLVVYFRRALKERFFLLRDTRRLYWAQEVDKCLHGEPFSVQGPSRRYPWDWQAAEDALLAALRNVGHGERQKLEELFQQWGLLKLRVQMLFWGNPWRQAEAALVLARFRRREVLPALSHLATHPRRDVRLAAVQAVGMLGVPEGRPVLLRFLRIGELHAVRTIRAALARCALQDPANLFPHLQESMPSVRRVVALVLADLAGPPHARGLLLAVHDSDPEVRAPVARALGRTGDPATFAPLADLTRDPVWFVRLQAVGSLGRVRVQEAREPLWGATRDPDWRIRLKAIEALHRWFRDPVALFEQIEQRGGSQESREALVDLLEREGLTWRAITRVHALLPYSREESQALVRHLLRAGTVSAIFYALEMHPDRDLRRALLHLVERSDHPEVPRRLQELRGSPVLEPDFRRELEQVLARRGTAG